MRVDVASLRVLKDRRMRLVCATALLFGVLVVTACESSDEGGPQAAAGGSGGSAGSSGKGAGKGSGEPCVDICYGTREYCEGGAIYSCSASPDNPCVRVYSMLEECEYGCDAAGQSCAEMPPPGAAGAPASGAAGGAAGAPSGGAAGADSGGAGGLAGADAGGASGAGAEAGSGGSGGA